MTRKVRTPYIQLSFEKNFIFPSIHCTLPFTLPSAIQNGKSTLTRRRSYILCLIFFISPLLYSKPLPEIAHSIKKEEKKFHEEEIKRLSTLRELEDIHDKLKNINTEIKSTQFNLDKFQKGLQNLKKIIVQFEKKIRDQKKQVKEKFPSRANDLFRIISPLELSLEQIKLSQTSTDIKLLKTYKENMTLFKKALKNQNVERNHITSFKKDLLKNKSKIEDKKSEKLSLLKKIRIKRALHLKNLKKIKAKYTNIKNGDSLISKTPIIKNFLEESFFERQGNLRYPLSGHPTKTIHDQKVGITLPLKGVFFRSKINRPVKSVFKGKVQFSGYIKKFGKIVIIDHGQNYFSVYGNNKKLLVDKNDIVKEGETVALSGHSGEFFGRGSYFEIRYLSEPLNPMKWINKNSKIRHQELL